MRRPEKLCSNFSSRQKPSSPPRKAPRQNQARGASRKRNGNSSTALFVAPASCRQSLLLFRGARHTHCGSESRRATRNLLSYFVILSVAKNLSFFGSHVPRKENTMQDLRYPIGRCPSKPVLTPGERREGIDAIAQTPARLKAAIAGLSPEQLDTPYRQ